MSPHFSVLAPQFLMKCQGPYCSPRGSVLPPCSRLLGATLSLTHCLTATLASLFCQHASHFPHPGFALAVPSAWNALPQMFTYLTPAFPLGLSSNVTSMSFSLVSVCNFLSGPFPSLSPALCFPMRLIPTEPARKCFEGRELVCLGPCLSSTPNAL